MAQDDASLVSGWNIAPNIAYTLVILPGSASCGVLLYDETGATLVATGAAIIGTAQPCVLIPQAGQTIGMADADLGWHLLLTTTGTESQRTIRIGPAVDLPDEIHPVYGDDGMALARATAAINAAAHYIDDVTVTCPLGLGAGLGDVVSVPVDGVAVVGQVESITWTATPDGASEQAVIRRHVAIAPEAFVEATPPTVADDAGTATHTTGTSGNVLTNDASGLAVVAVNGMASKVGTAVDGSNGGSFVIASDGSWTFSPDGDFALLSGSETADTSVTYHASDGTAEAMAILTITVSHANTALVAVDDTGETDASTTTSGNVLTNDTDTDLDTLTVSQVAGSAANVGVPVAGSAGGLFTIASNGAWTFDPDGDFAALTGEQTATTSVTYRVSDGVAEDEGSLTVTVTPAATGSITLVGMTSQAGQQANYYEVALPAGLLPGDVVVVATGCMSYKEYINGGVVSPDGYIEDAYVTRNATWKVNLSVSHKVLGPSPESSITVVGPGQGTYRGAGTVVMAFRGVDATTPLDVSAVSAPAPTTGVLADPGPVTPLSQGAVVVSACAWTINNITAITPPSNCTEHIEATHGPGTAYVVGLAVAPWAGSGQFDPGPWATTGLDGNCASCAVTIALRPTI
jgi:VCBS repeat-containing protein